MKIKINLEHVMYFMAKTLSYPVADGKCPTAASMVQRAYEDGYGDEEFYIADALAHFEIQKISKIVADLDQLNAVDAYLEEMKMYNDRWYSGDKKAREISVEVYTSFYYLVVVLMYLDIVEINQCRPMSCPKLDIEYIYSDIE